MTIDIELQTLATRLGELLKQRGHLLAVAESCTGGWLSETITSIAGSSTWFDRGFITYSNQAKQDMLGVKHSTLTQFGAVSAQTVQEMAEGALTHSRAHCTIAITGIAGPEGGSIEKPVGTVWIAAAAIGKLTQLVCYHFEGDREMIRRQAVICALGECFK
ncbi:MAG TPA: nicotinamide-nucleotide amidohydrolase family protein [Gammaproteobacteria bacterium]|nr:nicotinamide-nucleotide amidohydrolase family protein [Gammaproteobacteria bacterium]